MSDWLKLEALEMGREIAAGRIDPVELAEAHLDAAEAHPVGRLAYARLTPGRARAEAEAARGRARAGTGRGPLDGVPLSWKDLFDSAGVATEAGSALLKGRVPERDAEVLASASAAGTVCLGKTHMSELAFSGLGLNPMTATPPCVNDEGAVAGGSSSGAAASVAFGLAAGAVGSDTGGSVRVPAAWNDLVGLKTTSGTLPMGGVVPLCPRFDTLGPLAHSVADAAAIRAAMSGRPAPSLDGADLSGTRIMVLETVALDDLEGPAAEGFERALAALERAGATLVRGRIEAVAEAMPLSRTLFAGEAYGVWKEAIEADPDAMFGEILARFRAGRHASAVEFVAAWRRLEELRGAYAQASAGVDAVALPTCPIMPPDRARLESDADYYAETNLATLRNTRIGNLMGLPGLTLPTGVPSAGLLLQTPPRTEGRLLRLGAAAERALA